MARYCFYCQRELKEGERCDCQAAQRADARREAQRSSDVDKDVNRPTEDSADSSAKSSSNETSETSDTNNSETRARDTKQEPHTGARERFTSRAREQFNRTKESTSERFRKTSANFDGSKVKSSLGRFAEEGRAFFRQIPQMLKDVVTRPENILALARRASNQWVIIVFLLEMLVTTLVLSLAYQNSSLGRFLAFSLNQAEQLGGSSPSPFALRILIIAASSYLVRLGAYLMALRLNFVPITLQQALKHAVPGGLYFTLLLFFGIFFNRSSGIQVLFILALAWGLRLLIDEKILREYAKLRHDRILPTLIGIYLLTFLIMALVISLTLPEIGRVRPPTGPTIVFDALERFLGI